MLVFILGNETVCIIVRLGQPSVGRQHARQFLRVLGEPEAGSTGSSGRKAGVAIRCHCLTLCLRPAARSARISAALIWAATIHNRGKVRRYLVRSPFRHKNSPSAARRMQTRRPRSYIGVSRLTAWVNGTIAYPLSSCRFAPAPVFQESSLA